MKTLFDKYSKEGVYVADFDGKVYFVDSKEYGLDRSNSTHMMLVRKSDGFIIMFPVSRVFESRCSYDKRIERAKDKYNEALKEQKKEEAKVKRRATLERNRDDKQRLKDCSCKYA